MKLLYNIFIKTPKLKLSSIKQKLAFNKTFVFISLLAVLIFLSRSLIIKLFYNTDIFKYTFLGGFISILLAVIIEEIIYRFMAFQIFKDTSSNFRIIATSFIFMLAHISPYSFYLDSSFKYRIIGLISIFIMGILFAYSYELSSNLVFPIMLHLGINSISLFDIPYNLVFSKNELISLASETIYLLIFIYILSIFKRFYFTNLKNKG